MSNFGKWFVGIGLLLLLFISFAGVDFRDMFNVSSMGDEDSEGIQIYFQSEAHMDHFVENELSKFVSVQFLGGGEASDGSYYMVSFAVPENSDKEEIAERIRKEKNVLKVSTD